MNRPTFDEKNPDRVDKIIVCQKTQIAPSGNWIGGHATSSVTVLVIRYFAVKILDLN